MEESSPSQPSAIETAADYLTGMGTPHPVHEAQAVIRKALLSMGFDEIENPLLLRISDLKRQYQEQMPVVLNYSYFLGAFSEEPEELSEEHISNVVGQMEGRTEQDRQRYVEAITSIAAMLSKGQISPDELTETIGKRLELKNEEAYWLVQTLFCSKDDVPSPTQDIIRPHMASSWIPTLRTVFDREVLPIKLFSCGIKVKRIPHEDSEHLRTTNGASLVIADKMLDVARSILLVEAILSHIGLKDVKIMKRRFTRRYFQDGTEHIVEHNGKRLGLFGFYSQDVLSEYNIDVPVFYFMIWIERLLMARDGYEDIRELVYPQLFGAWNLRDRDIAESIDFINRPKTPLGERIAHGIITISEKYGDIPSPCGFPAWTGNVHMNRQVTKDKDGGEIIEELPLDQLKEMDLEVVVMENMEGLTLCGPAYLNLVAVQDGNIVSIKKEDWPAAVKKGAVSSGIRFLDAFANMAASQIESAIPMGKANIAVKMVSGLEDLNLKMSSAANRYTIAHKKKVNLKGPLLMRVVLRPIKESPACGPGDIAPYYVKNDEVAFQGVKNALSKDDGGARTATEKETKQKVKEHVTPNGKPGPTVDDSQGTKEKRPKKAADTKK